MEKKQNYAVYIYNGVGLCPLPQKDLGNATPKAIGSLSKWGEYERFSFSSLFFLCFPDFPQ